MSVFILFENNKKKRYLLIDLLTSNEQYLLVCLVQFIIYINNNK